MLVKQRSKAKPVTQYKQELKKDTQFLRTQSNLSSVASMPTDNPRLSSQAHAALLQRTLGNQSVGKLLQSIGNSIDGHMTGQQVSVQNGNSIQRETHSSSQSSSSETVPSKRRIIIDANVIDQINRGNQQAASTLLQLHTSSELYISRYS